MNVTFVYTDVGIDNSRKFNQGIAQLSSCLKQAGHKTSLIHLFEEVVQEDCYVELIRKHSPDIIAYSFISNLFDEIKKYASWTKKNFEIPIICGGPHPTLAPDECMETGLFDIICRGEGEAAIVELCNKLQKKENITDIRNLWVKSEGKVYKNPVGPLVEDLDLLPSLDYELFNYESLVDSTGFKRLVTMASRGCPYDCTYCCNHIFKELYPNKNKYVRFRSVDKTIEEIEKGLSKYPFLEQVRFFDDTLTLKKSWFREFAQKYKEKIGLPYSTNDRVNQIDEEVASLLKDSGCNFVEFGIESGNKKIREDIMKRRTPDEQIVSAFALCRKHGIRTSAFNIIGVPAETFSSALDTIKLNARANPDKSYLFYFHPYIGTKLNELCIEKGLLSSKSFKSIYEGPTLNLETMTENETVFAFTFFQPLIKLYRRYYQWPEPVARFFDNATTRLLSSKYYPKAASVFLLPYCIKCYKFPKKLIKFFIKRLRKFFSLISVRSQ